MGRRFSTTLPDNWQELIIEGSSIGKSKTEILVELGVGIKAHANLLTLNPEYAEAWEEGKQRSEAWWEKVGREALSNPKGFNTAVWFINMKNRFGWRDTPLAADTGGKILPDKVGDEEIMARYAKKGNKHDKETAVN